MAKNCRQVCFVDNKFTWGKKKAKAPAKTPKTPKTKTQKAVAAVGTASKKVKAAKNEINKIKNGAPTTQTDAVEKVQAAKDAVIVAEVKVKAATAPKKRGRPKKNPTK